MYDHRGPKIPMFFKLWFAFCALMSVAMVGGVAFVVYKVLAHFGIL